MQDPEEFERQHTAAAAPPAPVAKPKKVRIVADTDEEDDEGFTAVGKGGKEIKYTSESILQNLQVIQEARGKKVSSTTDLHPKQILMRL